MKKKKGLTLDNKQAEVVKAVCHGILAEMGKNKDKDKGRDDIEEYVLKKYKLKDIKKKDLFVVLNMLFIISGTLTLLVFIYGGVNVVSIIGTLITIFLGTVIFRMVKKYGVKIEEKEKKEKEEKEK